MKTKHTLLVLFVLLSFRLSASHLTGGYFSWKYLGPSSGSGADYVITLTLIRDCSGAVQFDSNIDIGIYRADNKQLLRQVPFKLDSTKASRSCSNACVEKGYYIDTVRGIPSIASGYHIVWERCCRPASVNLITGTSGEQEMGYRFYGFLPGMFVNNTTPDISSLPVLKACLNDTAVYTFDLYDSEGDSLLIEIVSSRQGASAADPFPAPAGSYKEPQDVVYKSGYSSVNPLGAGNYYQFDPAGKKLSFSCSTEEGLYPVTFSIKEYRDTLLVSHTFVETAVLINTSFCTEGPVRFAATAVPDDYAADLKWQVCRTDIVEQYIERSTTSRSSGFIRIDTIGASIRNYRDEGILSDRTYYYHVSAKMVNNLVLQSNTDSVSFWGAGLNIPAYNNLSVYPNPFNDKVTLSAQGTTIQSYRISDCTGRMVLQKSDTESLEKQEIDLSFLSPGVFIIEVLTGSGTHFNRKLIKN